MVYITYNSYSLEYFSFENNCPVKDFLHSVEDKKLQSKMYTYLNLLEEYGRVFHEPYVKYLYSSIYELRIRQSSNIARILFFYDGNKIVLTNGFIKKSNKTPRNEITKAIKYRKYYFERSKANERY